MSKNSKTKPATKKAKTQTVAITGRPEEVTGLVLLRSKTADSEDPDRIGLSFQSQDTQELNMEVAASKEFADTLSVDKTYSATIAKGASAEHPTFTVHHSNEVDNGDKYHEKMVVKGDLEGHIYTRIFKHQETVFYEKQENHIQFVEVTEEVKVA